MLTRNPQTRRILGAGTLALLYLVAATSLAPALTMLLAAIEGGHHVVLQQTTQGMQVVLRHQCLNSLQHRHGVVARSLIVFAHRSTAPQSDHVIPFGSMDTVQQASTRALEPVAKLPAPEGKVAFNSGFQSTDATVETVAVPRFPPAASRLRLTARSTVLLI